MYEELIRKAKAAADAEELMKLAEEENAGLDEEAAKELFARLHPETGAIADDELDNVSGGGCGGNNNDTKDEDSCYGLKGGEHVHLMYGELCPGCYGMDFEILYCCGGSGTASERYMTKCLKCGTEMGHWAYELKLIR